MPSLFGRRLTLAYIGISSKQLQSMGVGMITHGISHQTSHKILGHYIVHYITKFQSCGRDN